MDPGCFALRFILGPVGDKFSITKQPAPAHQAGVRRSAQERALAFSFSPHFCVLGLICIP